jgi:hypothetical protein
VFSKAAAAAIFTTLGNASSSSPTATNIKVSLVKSPDERGACSCSIKSDWCDTICTGNGACDHSADGCGTLWLYECDGRCFVYTE